MPQTLAALDIKPGGVYVDATFGGGGHSRAIMESLDAQGHLYSFDQDEDAVERAFDDPRFTIVYSNFRYLSNFMRYYGVEGLTECLPIWGCLSTTLMMPGAASPSDGAVPLICA